MINVTATEIKILKDSHILVQPGLIFLAPDESEEVRASGIIVTASKSSPATRARITHIHSETADSHCLRVDDVVLFNPFSVREVNLSATEKVLAIHVSDILARIGD